MSSPKPLRIALDCSVTSRMQADDWQWLQARAKEGRLQVWDSPLALFEMISHVYTTAFKGDRVDWVRERCAKLETVAKTRMLPPSGLVVRTAIREHLKWDGPDGDHQSEIEPYLTMRRFLAQGLKQVDSGEIYQILIQPVRHCQKGFYRTLAAVTAQMAPELEELRVRPDWNPRLYRERIESVLRESRDLRRELFIHCMRLHGLGDWEMSALALEWEEVPFLDRLMRLYSLQTACFIAGSRQADLGDFIDFQWGPQIVAGRIQAIVMDRPREYHESLKTEKDPQVKVLSFNELKTAFQPV